MLFLGCPMSFPFLFTPINTEAMIWEELYGIERLYPYNVIPSHQCWVWEEIYIIKIPKTEFMIQYITQVWDGLNTIMKKFKLTQHY